MCHIQTRFIKPFFGVPTNGSIDDIALVSTVLRYTYRTQQATLEGTVHETHFGGVKIDAVC